MAGLQAVLRFCMLPLVLAFTLTGCELESLEEIAPEAAAAASSSSSVTDASSTTTATATGTWSGFVWKPISESDGKLVVLLPTALTGNVSSCGIYSSSSGTGLIEAGRYTGDHNGNRAHFRFNSPGAAYGQNVYVVAVTSGGTSYAWLIPNGANRTENISTL